MKRCAKCGIAKPLEEFYKASGMRDGRRSDCKACNLEAQARRRRLDPDENRRRARHWQLANPDRVAAKDAEYRSTGRKRLYDRKSHLKRKFGLTLEDYDVMLASQGGVCAICGRQPRPDIALHVDHDPASGRIRGLLCFRCNNMLGDAHDDTSILARAARYLEPVTREPELEARLAALKARRPAWA